MRMSGNAGPIRNFGMWFLGAERAKGDARRAEQNAGTRPENPRRIMQLCFGGAIVSSRR